MENWKCLCLLNYMTRNGCLLISLPVHDTGKEKTAKLKQHTKENSLLTML